MLLKQIDAAILGMLEARKYNPLKRQINFNGQRFWKGGRDNQKAIGARFSNSLR